MYLAKSELEIVKGLSRGINAVIETVESVSDETQELKDRIERANKEGVMSSDVRMYLLYGNDDRLEDAKKSASED